MCFLYWWQWLFTWPGGENQLISLVSLSLAQFSVIRIWEGIHSDYNHHRLCDYWRHHFVKKATIFNVWKFIQTKMLSLSSFMLVFAYFLGVQRELSSLCLFCRGFKGNSLVYAYFVNIRELFNLCVFCQGIKDNS